MHDTPRTSESRREWKIENGRFYENGQYKFLKIAKPLRNFADHRQIDQLIAQLDVFKSKNYNVLSLNCYWHHFDADGDGIPDKPLEHLARLVDTIYSKGMYPALSVVKDTEYGFNTAVVSVFHEGYRRRAHVFIKI